MVITLDKVALGPPFLAIKPLEKTLEVEVPAELVTVSVTIKEPLEA